MITAYIMRFYDTFGEALLNGMFMAVSATTNAGFSLTNESLIPYFNDYFLQSVTMILIILGAIGFPVLIEVKAFFSKKSASFPFFVIYENYNSDIWCPSHLGCAHDFYIGIDELLQGDGMA